MPKRAKPLKNDFPIKGTGPRWFYRQICWSSPERNTQAQPVPERRNMAGFPVYMQNQHHPEPKTRKRTQNRTTVWSDYENKTHTFFPWAGNVTIFDDSGSPQTKVVPTSLRAEAVLTPTSPLPRSLKCTLHRLLSISRPQHPRLTAPQAQNGQGRPNAGASCP